MSMPSHLNPYGAAHALPRGFANRRTPWAGLIADAALLLAERIETAVRRRRDMRLLSEMDDYRLHDIGITRSEIERAVRSGRR